MLLHITDYLLIAYCVMQCSCADATKGKGDAFRIFAQKVSSVIESKENWKLSKVKRIGNLYQN
jgi:hypothetical protein